MKAKHRQPSEETMDDKESNSDSNEQDSEPETVVENTDKDDIFSTDSDSANEEDVWLQVMKEVLKETDISTLVKPNESTFSKKKLIKAIGIYVEDIIEFADEIQNTDTYEAIREETQRLEDAGYEEEEAKLAAWTNRRYLVQKKVLEPCIELLKENLKEDNGDSEPEEEYDDDDN